MSYLKTFNVVRTAVMSDKRDIDIMSSGTGNALAQNRRNSLLRSVRTSRQGSCNLRVGCWDIEPLNLLNAKYDCYCPCLIFERIGMCKIYIELYFTT